MFLHWGSALRTRLCDDGDMTEMPIVGSIPVWDLADRLGKSLQHRGMRVQDMADYLGVSRNTIGNYLSRRTVPDKRTLILWAMRTGVTREWLETGETPGGGPGGDGGGQISPGNRSTREYGSLPICNEVNPHGALSTRYGLRQVALAA